jgi:hypothetical protein
MRILLKQPVKCGVSKACLTGRASGFFSIEIEHRFSGHFVDVRYWPSGHAAYIVEWLLLGVKRTSRLHSEVSAYDPFRTLHPNSGI